MACKYYLHIVKLWPSLFSFWIILYYLLVNIKLFLHNIARPNRSITSINKTDAIDQRNRSIVLINIIYAIDQRNRSTASIDILDTID